MATPPVKTAAVRRRGPPNRAMPSTGPPACPRKTPPIGRPPNGHDMRAASARVIAAGKASARAPMRRGGTARQATAGNSASITMSAIAPARVNERAHMSPGTKQPSPANQPDHSRVRGRRPSNRHQRSPAAGKARIQNPHGGRERASPTPARMEGTATRPRRGDRGRSSPLIGPGCSSCGGPGWSSSGGPRCPSSAGARWSSCGGPLCSSCGLAVCPPPSVTVCSAPPVTVCSPSVIAACSQPPVAGDPSGCDGSGATGRPDGDGTSDAGPPRWPGVGVVTEWSRAGRASPGR